MVQMWLEANFRWRFLESLQWVVMENVWVREGSVSECNAETSPICHYLCDLRSPNIYTLNGF